MRLACVGDEIIDQGSQSLNGTQDDIKSSELENSDEADPGNASDPEEKRKSWYQVEIPQFDCRSPRLRAKISLI